MPDGLYDADFYLWTQQQARLLREAARAGTNLPLDWDNLAEEMESVGRSQRRELSSRITVLVEHVLKLSFSRAAAPRRLWVATVRAQRREIASLLEVNPSLRGSVAADARAAVAAVAGDVAAMLAEQGELADGAEAAVSAAAFSDDELLGDWLPEPPAA